MKRIGCLIAALSLLMTLSACHTGGEAEQTLRIGVALYQQEDTFIETVTRELPHYTPSITSLISYSPAGLPFRNLAACTAPLANTFLEYAVWEKVMTSSSPAKITS